MSQSQEKNKKNPTSYICKNIYVYVKYASNWKPDKLTLKFIWKIKKQSQKNSERGEQ